MEEGAEQEGATREESCEAFSHGVEGSTIKAERQHLPITCKKLASFDP